MDLKAVTGQLYIINGEPQAAANVPGLQAQSPPARAARGRSSDYLFVHLTLSGPAAETEALAQDLLDSISQRFYQTPGSITAALRNAIVETNDLLLRRNVSGSDASREGAITCAVLRGQELFIAQAGESFALLGHHFGVERLPAAAPPRMTPLGRTAGLDLRFYHNWLEPGHMLLLADPRMAHLPASTIRPALVESEDLADSLEALAGLLASDTARLILIQFTDEEPVIVPQPAVVKDTGTRLEPPTTPPRRDPQYARDTATAAQITRPRPPFPRPRSDGAAARQVAPIVRQAGLATRPAGATARRTVPAARQATSHAAYGLGRFMGWLAQLLARLNPARPATAPAEEAVSWAWPALVAIIIPVIIALAVATTYFQRGLSNRFSDIRQEMGQAIGLAEQAEDNDTARTYYNQVLALGVEAETLRPGNADVQLMRQTALAQLDRLDDITRLQASVLYTYGENAGMGSVVLRNGLNGDIYTLDRVSSEVWLHNTSEDYLVLTTPEPEPLLFTNQAIGNQVVTTLADMLWRNTGQNISRPGLAVLDNSGALINFYPDFSDRRAVPLGLASSWRQPTAITTYAENLYILDRAAEKVWRYLPDGEGFTITDGQEAIEFADGADLAQAVDVAIYSEDGSVIILYQDGRLRRFVGGRPLWTEIDLLNNGLQSPLIAPSALKIIGQGLNSSLFVADPGSARIVQFSLGGIFLAQYKGTLPDGTEAFGQIADFDVAEAPLRIFAVAGNKLILAVEN